MNEQEMNMKITQLTKHVLAMGADGGRTLYNADMTELMIFEPYIQYCAVTGISNLAPIIWYTGSIELAILLMQKNWDLRRHDNSWSVVTYPSNTFKIYPADTPAMAICLAYLGELDKAAVDHD